MREVEGRDPREGIHDVDESFFACEKRGLTRGRCGKGCERFFDPRPPAGIPRVADFVEELGED